MEISTNSNSASTDINRADLTAQKTDAETSPENSWEEKTFTQKELDDIIKARLERAKKDAPSKEELAVFREWQENRHSIEQKALDDIAAANAARDAVENDKRALETAISCIAKGVAPEYVDDVITLARDHAAGGMSLEDAVDRLLEKYPNFRAGTSGRFCGGITTGISTKHSPDTKYSGRACFIDVIKENQVKRKPY